MSGKLPFFLLQRPRHASRQSSAEPCASSEESPGQGPGRQWERYYPSLVSGHSSKYNSAEHRSDNCHYSAAVNAGAFDDMNLIGKKDLVLIDRLLRKKGSEYSASVSDKTPKITSGGKHTGGNEYCDGRYLARGQGIRSRESIPSSSIYLRKESVITGSSPEPPGIICTQNSPMAERRDRAGMQFSKKAITSERRPMLKRKGIRSVGNHTC